MNHLQIHEVQQGTPEWLELRKGKYTGSNTHKLLTAGDKTEVINGEIKKYAAAGVDGFRGNFHTKRGHILEDEAIELYERIKGVQVQRPGFVTNTRYPKCGYSPDGLTDDRTIEVKCFIESKHLETAKYVPFDIMAQVEFGLLICEKAACDLLLYNPDLEPSKALIIITIKKQPAIFSNIRRILVSA